MEILLKRDISIVNDEDDASNTPLHLAALEGHSRVVQILLSSGAAVDARYSVFFIYLALYQFINAGELQAIAAGPF